MSGSLDPIAAATEATEVLIHWAGEVDRQRRFPTESVDALRSRGLLGYMVPRELGGSGGTYTGLATIAATLGQGCLSTAIIWAMHSQQVVTLADHAQSSLADVLRSVAADGSLIASVTSEAGGTGQLLAVRSALIPEGDKIRLRRSAPIVSYAGEARYYLVTMRRSDAAPALDSRLVLVDGSRSGLTVGDEWNALGMRGTRSVSASFDVLLAPECTLAEPFPSIAARTFIPAGHVGWTAAWYGAASGALRRYVQWLRTRGSQAQVRLDSDLLRSRLADLRARLDPIAALLGRIAARLDRWRSDGVSLDRYHAPSHQIELNSLKIAGSEAAFHVVDELMQLAGLREGYLEGSELGLERVFRDLRSASFMYGNERLRQANGRLLLVEQQRRPLEDGLG
jgi:alkylation response protein AidB-like acyl-CoA dehydrogenase